METRKRNNVVSSITTGALGLAMIGLAACSSGESTPTTGTPAPGGSAALQGAIVFVNNTGDRTLTSVALRGDTGNFVLNTLGAASAPNAPGVFDDKALGDMQFSEGEWLFVNTSGINDGQNNNQNVGTKVAAIDPFNAATPIFRTNLTTAVRPVHIYRDPTDGEIIWSMNDGVTLNTATPGDDTINCNTTNRAGGPVQGGSVTIIHNSHLGPGASNPEIKATVCLLADGHKVAAFSQPTATDGAILRRAFVSSETAGEIAVIDNEPASNPRYQLIRRIDLCNPSRQTCDQENPVGTTPFTPNASAPHGIRWSKVTGKVYSLQEGYNEIAEIDPTTFAVTPKFDLTGTSYTSIGISPDGRFLLLRGETTAPAQATKLGVIDLSLASPVRTDFTIPELNGTSPGSFKFSPDGRRFYILAGNGATATKKNRLFAFDASTLAATVPSLTLLREIVLADTGAHSFDVLALGSGEAKYIAVSNSTDNSLSIINAANNLVTETIQNVGALPGSVLIYHRGAAETNNQASS